MQTRLYLFAHNWAFDALVLHTFKELRRRGWELGRVIVESPPIVMTWRKDGRTIEMLDTLNWWRVPLKTLGKSIGLSKLTMPPKRATPRSWDRYCRNDVEIIRRTLHSWWAFLEQYDLGGFARTLAGQSMRAYKHRFMDHPILIDNHPQATALARESYHGGRTECFRLGRVAGPIHCLDVNSMYPAVMRWEAYPSILRLHARKASVKDLKRWLTSLCVVARVKVETPEPCFAHVLKDKLIFPVGSFTTVLTTPDLLYGIRMGYVKSVSEVAVYERARLFTRFVETIYQLRREASDRGDETNKYLLKILMNSLYGKFAQRGNVWEDARRADDDSIRIWSEIDAETGLVTHFRQFAGVVQVKSREPEAFASHPAIAAHVTAYARQLLWNAIKTAGRGEVFYCDTDSVYVTDLGKDRLHGMIDSASLGSLKLEESHAWMLFHGPKDYETPTTRKTKGVKAAAVWHSANRLTQDQWSTVAGSLAAGQLEAPRTKQVTKVLSRIYGKGTVDSSGRVSPFRLRE